MSSDAPEVQELKVNVKHAIADDCARRKAVGSGDVDVIQQLFVMPEKLVPLLAVLDSTDSQEDLDAKLEKVGLEFFDRGSTPHCLDLRSLFLDKLTVRRSGRRWGMLPLSGVRPAQKCALVREFVRAIYDSARLAFDRAAELVDYNSKHLSKNETRAVNRRDGYSNGTRMIALLFATIEETISGSWRVRQQLSQPWDLDTNCAIASGTSLKDQLSQFAIAWTTFPSYLVAGTFPADGYLPLSSGDGPSIRTAFSNMRENGTGGGIIATLYPPAPTGREAESRRERIIRNALSHLCDLKLADCEMRTTPRECKYYRVFANRSKLSSTIYPRADRVRVANRLGFWPTTDNNQVDRIPEDCGYSKEQREAFLEQLSELCVPEWMQKAGEWYLKHFHGDLDRVNWPTFRT